MASNVRHPLWLPASTEPGMRVFSLLFFIETIARASLATVVPLQAYDILKDEQQVSFLYTAVSMSTLAASFVIPLLIRKFSRRWTYTIGAGCLIGAAVALWSQTLPGQATGMFLRVFGTACLNITLNLYIMEFIRKQDYVKNDSLRLAFSTVGWTFAPYFGVWLYTNHGMAATYGWAIAWALILSAVFWYLRITDNTPIRPGRLKPVNPGASKAVRSRTPTRSAGRCARAATIATIRPSGCRARSTCSGRAVSSMNSAAALPIRGGRRSSSTTSSGC